MDKEKNYKIITSIKLLLGVPANAWIVSFIISALIANIFAFVFSLEIIGVTIAVIVFFSLYIFLFIKTSKNVDYIHIVFVKLLKIKRTFNKDRKFKGNIYVA